MNRSHVTIITLAAALLAACASAPPANTQTLDQARTLVQTFSQNPAASEVASRELEAARSSLAKAEDALKEEKLDEAEHYAFLAQNQAWIGEARIAERDARRQVARGEAERKQVMLEARNAELEAQAKLAAQQTSRGMVLSLSGVMFDTGKATLKPGAAPTLDRVSSYLMQYPKTRLIVEGHTDNQGRAETNQQLSQLRARSVADALVMRGVPHDRLDIVGHGAEMPVASNGTPEGRQQNRRVEMVFSDDAGRFAEGAKGVNR
jgi:outer membrane protein OmpA-like peptidoglycan-associated protein